MEEIEVPTEHLQEEIHNHAHASTERWQLQVALSSALLAVLAALAALLSGHAANESMLEQIRASNDWSHYQSKSIKASLLKSKAEVLTAMGKEVPAKTEEDLKRYEKEQEEISEQAKEKTAKSEIMLARHERYSFAVTFSQVAIGIAAISVLTRRRAFFKVSLLFGLAGFAFLVLGFLVKG